MLVVGTHLATWKVFSLLVVEEGWREESSGVIFRISAIESKKLSLECAPLRELLRCFKRGGYSVKLVVSE